MKRLFILILLFLPPLLRQASAQREEEMFCLDFKCTVDGIRYGADIHTMTAAVISCGEVPNMKYSGDIVIPEKVTLSNKDYPPAEYTVTTLNSSCFYYSSITSVDIPETVVSIYGSAFYKCTELKRINLKNVRKIWGNPIAKSGVESIEVNPDNPSYDVMDGMLYSKSHDTIVICPSVYDWEEYIIPNGVKVVGGSCFFGSGIKKVVLPSTVYSLQEGAFFDSEIESIDGTNLEMIGASAFTLSKLKSITLSSKLKGISDYAFHRCPLESIELPDTMKYIGWEAFKDCPLRSIKIPENVCIRAYAFEGCQLSEVTIPASVTFDHHNPFNGQVDENGNNRALHMHFLKETPPETDTHGATSRRAEWDRENYILYIPYGIDGHSYQEYKKHKEWGLYKNFILENGPEGIQQSAQPSPQSTIYTLDGLRLKEKPTKGIYIQNGKKVLR